VNFNMGNNEEQQSHTAQNQWRPKDDTYDSDISDSSFLKSWNPTPMKKERYPLYDEIGDRMILNKKG